MTPAGEEVAPLARAVLDDVRRLLDASGRRREPLAGRFGLGAIATLGPYLMPHLLRPLRRRFPLLELHLREGMTHVLLDELRSGGLDAVLAALPVDEASLAGRAAVPRTLSPRLAGRGSAGAEGARLAG